MRAHRCLQTTRPQLAECRICDIDCGVRFMLLNYWLLITTV